MAMNDLLHDQQDILESEIDTLIMFHRATNVPLESFLNMPAVRYDVYVERFMEIRRQEDVKEQGLSVRNKLRFG